MQISGVAKQLKKEMDDKDLEIHSLQLTLEQQRNDMNLRTSHLSSSSSPVFVKVRLHTTQNTDTCPPDPLWTLCIIML
jgi:hypothetical protein